MQDALKNVSDLLCLFDFSSVLRPTAEYQNEIRDKSSTKVAPFCFDFRLFVHSLDVGFSLDVQGIEMLVYPAVELLALIGIQRFRPLAQKQHFDYWIWKYPMPISTATAIACGAAEIEASLHYRFSFRFRDDQRRYKAFGYATLIKGE